MKSSLSAQWRDLATKLSAPVGVEASRPGMMMCEQLGERAAEMSLHGQISPEDAVVKLASDRPLLNENHIQNICWVANNAMFRKIADARKQAGQHLVFQYPLIQPDRVLARLNKLSQPMIIEEGDADYAAPPLLPVDPEMEAQKLSAAFPSSYSHADIEMHRRHAVEDLFHLRECTRRLANEATEKRAAAEAEQARLEGVVARMIKTAVLEGVPVSAIVDLWSHHPSGGAGVVATMQKVAYAWADDPTTLVAMRGSARQPVRGTADLTHPLYEAYSDLHAVVKVAHILRETEAHAWSEVEEAERGVREATILQKSAANLGGALAGGAAAAGLTGLAGQGEHAAPAMLVGGVVGSGWNPGGKYKLDVAGKGALALGGTYLGARALSALTNKGRKETQEYSDDIQTTAAPDWQRWG